MKVEAHKLGLATGILWGLLLFVMTLVSLPTGYGAEFLKVMESLYPGYHVSIIGSVVGLVYGFFDGYIGLYLVAWLYSRLLRAG
jgi:hypothetical protein